jgi:hypothetical protein
LFSKEERGWRAVKLVSKAIGIPTAEALPGEPISRGEPGFVPHWLGGSIDRPTCDSARSRKELRKRERGRKRERDTSRKWAGPADRSFPVGFALSLIFALSQFFSGLSES